MSLDGVELHNSDSGSARQAQRCPLQDLAFLMADVVLKVPQQAGHG